MYNLSLLHGSVNTIMKSVGPKHSNEVSPKLVIIAVILVLTAPGVSPACGRAEYPAGQECSLMCGEGLTVKRLCSSALDELCEPLEGYDFIDSVKDGYRRAVEHTKCSPGQYIKQQDTAASDSLFDDCTGDTCSDRSFTPHLCDLMELMHLRKRPASYDTEYAERYNTGAIMAGVIVGIITVLCEILVAIFIIQRRMKKHQSPIQPDHYCEMVCCLHIHAPDVGRYSRGTATSDSLFGDCLSDTYSNRSYTFSIRYNLCVPVELMHLRKGPASYDTEYAEKKNTSVITANIITVLWEIVVANFIIRRKRKNSQTQPDSSMKLHNLSLLYSSVNTIMKSVGPNPSNEVLPKLVIIAVILLLTVPGVSPACGRAEYLIDKECCPMCGPGYYVRRHCTEYTSTTCVPCPPSTFTDAPNGLVSCISCTVCDTGEGLRVKRSCSSTLDAICEPLDGHYCIDPIKDGCRGAKEHEKCIHGQYIKHQGTATSDTICSDCVGDTYSDGSFTSCKPHTQCELMGLIIIRKGNTSHDTECAERHDAVATAVGLSIAGIITICGVLMGIIIYWKRKKHEPVAQPDILRVFLNRDQQGSHHCQVPNTADTTEMEPDSTAR